MAHSDAAMQVDLSATARFESFIERAAPLLASVGPPLADFLSFVKDAQSLVADPVRASLTELRPKILRVRKWLTNHDLLSIAKLSAQEDPYTELLGWALRPDIHPESGLARQRLWLRHAPFAEQLGIRKTAVPITQLDTEDGVPDMVLAYERGVVVIEAKTGSQEHKAPSGQFQTVAYPKAVRRRLHVHPHIPIFVVFLTVDGGRAQNPDAYNTTYGSFCLSLLAALDPFDPYRLAAELRAAFSILVTHMLSAAVPSGVDIRAAVDTFAEWDDRLSDDVFLVRHLNDIASFTTAFARLCSEVDDEHIPRIR